MNEPNERMYAIAAAVLLALLFFVLVGRGLIALFGSGT